MSFLKRFQQALGNIGQGKNWEHNWNVRLAGLTAALGESASDRLYHSPTPLYLGGDADVLVFPHFVDGFTYVTADLTGESDQLPSAIGKYELMMCTRSEADWAANLISRLSRYTLEAFLNPGETMDFAMFGDSSLVALLFTQCDVPTFNAFGAEQGLLLCVGITQSELEFCHEESADVLIQKLKDAGILPFTDLKRSPVV